MLRSLLVLIIVGCCLAGQGAAKSSKTCVGSSAAQVRAAGKLDKVSIATWEIPAVFKKFPSPPTGGPPSSRAHSPASQTDNLDIAGKLQLAGLFALWYASNAGYNVFNAFVKKDMPYPWVVSTLQLLLGLPIAAILWAGQVR